jgi:hypothetical protein
MATIHHITSTAPSYIPGSLFKITRVVKSGKTEKINASKPVTPKPLPTKYSVRPLFRVTYIPPKKKKGTG